METNVAICTPILREMDVRSIENPMATTGDIIVASEMLEIVAGNTEILNHRNKFIPTLDTYRGYKSQRFTCLSGTEIGSIVSTTIFSGLQNVMK